MKDWNYNSAKDMTQSPLDRLRSTRREQGLVSTLVHNAVSSMVYAFYRTYHRMEIVGRSKLPIEPPFIIAANHSSHYDAPVLASALPRSARGCAYSVAAGDIFFTTPTRSIFSAMVINALPLWRKKVTTHALAELRERLVAGHSGLILFPEGARSRDGALLRFKPGIGMIVAGTNIPVYPCHIDGAFEALPAGGRIPRPVRIVVRVGDPLTFAQTPNSREGWDSVSESIRSSIVAMMPGATPLAGPDTMH